MAKYAKYDPTQIPALVLGWYNTEEFDYGNNLPPAENLLELTDEEWKNRTIGKWQIVNKSLCPYSHKPNLADFSILKNKAMLDACQKHIVSGFSSSALGSVHNYASSAIDQRNLILAAQSRKGGLLSCSDLTGAWGRILHTQDQAQEVLEDFVAMADQARAKLTALEANISNAKTVPEAQEKSSG